MTIQPYREDMIRIDLLKGILSKPEIAKKYGLKIGAVNRVEHLLIAEGSDVRKSTKKKVIVSETSEPTYQDIVYPDGEKLTVEQQWLSCPYYNPLELKGWERDQFEK